MYQCSNSRGTVSVCFITLIYRRNVRPKNIICPNINIFEWDQCYLSGTINLYYTIYPIIVCPIYRSNSQMPLNCSIVQISNTHNPMDFANVALVVAYFLSRLLEFLGSKFQNVFSNNFEPKIFFRAIAS